MQKVLLINMPFGAVDRQAIGISLLKAGLENQGFSCDVQYLNFPFAKQIGVEEYLWISSSLPYTAFAGDWTFTEALYGPRWEADRAYIHQVLQNTWQLSEEAIRRILRIKSAVPAFLDYCMQAVPWDNYSIIGFTSTFEQNIASLALAQQIKAAFPEKILCFGGANWEKEMGIALHQKFPFVDFACSGEADESFPALVQCLMNKTSDFDTIATIPGIIYREEGQTRFSGSAKLIKTMDQLPYPDYSDYFQAVANSSFSGYIYPKLLMETSRGCWWGAKSHCTFCGLNGGSMAFRSKSANRAFQELDYLVKKWGVSFIEIVDNILDMRYFNDFLPQLAAYDQEVRLFYEVKANLKRKHIKLLHEAGVHRIQPGIESMNNHILKLMRKGTTALKNILLLRLCREYQIEVDWNLLYGFPGEKKEDYDKMLELFPFIHFLNPPAATGPIRLDRFSPYFMQPASFGLKNLRPINTYSFLYPFDEDFLEKIAYYFDFDYEQDVNPKGLANEVIAHVEMWRQNPEQGELRALYATNHTLILHDSRSTAHYPEVCLNGPEQAAYEYCDEIRSFSSIVRHLKNTFPDANLEEEGIKNFLDSLIANKLMIEEEEQYLSLALGLGRANKDSVNQESEKLSAKAIA